MYNSVRIVDNLAEITRYQDRHVLEKSLMKTLNELFPGENLRLFAARKRENRLELNLLSFCVNDVIGMSEEADQQGADCNELEQAVARAVGNSDIELMWNAGGEGMTAIYPAYDTRGDIFAVLVHQREVPPGGNDQRLVYGILRVYANYLALIDKSQRDKLTGLFNRETLNDEVTRLLVRGGSIPQNAAADDSRRRPLQVKHWLALVDIDSFKAINDNFGHLYGDEVIILIARLMESGVMRDSDLVFRYGGEEFVLLLDAPDEASIRAGLERLRLTIEAHNFPQIGTVTISAGFVEVAGQQSPADVIGEADNALYYAKKHGRNQVQGYRELVESGRLARNAPVTESDIELF